MDRAVDERGYPAGEYAWMDWSDGPLKIMPWWNAISHTGVHGAATKAIDQEQSEPAAEPALAIADREHEGADDQPHRAFGKAAQHPAQRLVGIVLDISRDPRERQADDADGADRHRFQDEAGDHGGKDRKIVPLIGVEAGWNRHEIERQPDQ